MPGRTHGNSFLAAAATLLALVLAVATIAAADQGGKKKDEGPCCFTNQKYAGVCEVVPEGKETCASILAYLNNPMSTGKPYCNATDVRGGWHLVKCSTDEDSGGTTKTSKKHEKRPPKK